MAVHYFTRELLRRLGLFYKAGSHNLYYHINESATDFFISSFFALYRTGLIKCTEFLRMKSLATTCLKTASGNELVSHQ